MKITKNPLFRIAGIVAIIYFGLFANTYKKESLGNRLSKDKIIEGIEMVNKQKYEIDYGLEKAKQEKAILNSNKDLESIQYKESEIACNSRVKIFYQVFSKNNQQIDAKETSFVIGDKSTPEIIELGIMGMKKDDKKSINIPNDYKSINQEMSNYLLSSGGSLRYDISIISAKNSDNNYQCQ